jgi:hypothetical protein
MSAAETFVLGGIDAAGMPACAAQRRRAARPATLISWPLAFSHVAARVHFIAERTALQIACASASPIASCHCCASYARTPEPHRQSYPARPKGTTFARQKGPLDMERGQYPFAHENSSRPRLKPARLRKAAANDLSSMKYRLGHRQRMRQLAASAHTREHGLMHFVFRNRAHPIDLVDQVAHVVPFFLSGPGR